MSPQSAASARFIRVRFGQRSAQSEPMSTPAGAVLGTMSGVGCSALSASFWAQAFCRVMAG